VNDAESEYEAKRIERGFELYRAVYGDDMPKPDPNSSLYVSQMMRHLFAETWGREALSVRDRRLVIMGVLAATGQADKVEIQFRRAQQLGELSFDQLEEVVLQLAAYCGWGMVSPLSMLVPHMRAEAEAGGVATAGAFAHSSMNPSQKATIAEED
jgi:4-carboxymuconolactone decarboxylase